MKLVTFAITSDADEPKWSKKFEELLLVRRKLIKVSLESNGSDSLAVLEANKSSLKYIEISGFVLDSKSLMNLLAEMVNLETLRIADCTFIAMERVLKLKKLKRVTVIGSTNVLHLLSATQIPEIEIVLLWLHPDKINESIECFKQFLSKQNNIKSVTVEGDSQSFHKSLKVVWYNTSSGRLFGSEKNFLKFLKLPAKYPKIYQRIGKYGVNLIITADGKFHCTNGCQ